MGGREGAMGFKRGQWRGGGEKTGETGVQHGGKQREGEEECSTGGNSRQRKEDGKRVYNGGRGVEVTRTRDTGMWEEKRKKRGGTLIKNKIKFSSYTCIWQFRVKPLQSHICMRKGFLVYEEMCKYFTIYEEAVSHI
jgi:hypothetical protein